MEEKKEEKNINISKIYFNRWNQNNIRTNEKLYL